PRPEHPRVDDPDVEASRGVNEGNLLPHRASEGPHIVTLEEWLDAVRGAHRQLETRARTDPLPLGERKPVRNVESNPGAEMAHILAIDVGIGGVIAEARLLERPREVR